MALREHHCVEERCCVLFVDQGNDFRHHLPDLDALEESMGCRLYRQWPICEARMVRRAGHAGNKQLS